MPCRRCGRSAFQLERAGAPTYRVRAFRRAAQVARELPPAELAQRARDGTLRALPGIGDTTAEVITQAVAGQQPGYLAKVLDEAARSDRARDPAERVAGTALHAALRGDCHTHSDWSDWGSSPWEMAETARDLGHEWIALTDHSPRLTVARGLSAEQLVEARPATHLSPAASTTRWPRPSRPQAARTFRSAAGPASSSSSWPRGWSAS